MNFWSPSRNSCSWSRKSKFPVPRLECPLSFFPSHQGTLTVPSGVPGVSGTRYVAEDGTTTHPAASRAYRVWPAQHKTAMESPSQRHGGSQPQGAEPSPCKSNASGLRWERYVACGCTRVRPVYLTELGFCSVPSSCSAGEGEIDKGRAQWQRDDEAPNCNNPDCRCP